MISVARIERWAEREQFQALFDGVVQNGRPLPLAARLRLSQPRSLELAALGIGLQRLLELSYGPEPAALAMARRVAAALERLGGAEVSDNQPGPGAMIAGVVGLLGVLDRLRLFGHPGLERLQPAAERALARANHALLEAAAGSSASPAHRGLVGDGIETAVVLWQLAGSERGAEAVAGVLDAESLRRGLVRSGAWKDGACAVLMALADAAAAALDAPEPCGVASVARAA